MADKKYARALSLREADRCERAQEDVCKCRCGGAKHGAARVSGGDGFASLPEDDPHHVDSPAQKKAKHDAAQARKWEARAEIERGRALREVF